MEQPSPYVCRFILIEKETKQLGEKFMHEHQNPGEKTAERGKDHLINVVGDLGEVLSAKFEDVRQAARQKADERSDRDRRQSAENL